MRAYKFVDLEHADAVERGCLKIGTLSSYAGLEGEKKDDREGVLIRKVSSLRISDSQNDPAGVNIAAQIGIVLGNGSDVRITNCSSELRHPNVYCFCMSSSSKNLRLAGERHQAVFEIKGVHSLAYILHKQNADRLKYALVKRVQYQSREVEVSAFSPEYPDPFVKDVSYTDEDEVRIIWSAPTSPIEPFITPESFMVANLLRRIA